MDEVLRNRIWYGFFNAKTNEIFSSLVAEEYKKYDFYMTIFLVVFTSGTVAAWGIWSVMSLLWGLIIAGTQLAQILKPVLLFPKYAETYNEKYAKFQEIALRYEELWFKSRKNSLRETEIENQFLLIKKDEGKINNLPSNIIKYDFESLQQEAESEANEYAKQNF